VQHLACEVSGRSVEAFEGYAQTLHVNVVPDRIKFPGFPSFLEVSVMFGSMYVKSNQFGILEFCQLIRRLTLADGKKAGYNF
jgi:hypothetical protein